MINNPILNQRGLGQIRLILPDAFLDQGSDFVEWFPDYTINVSGAYEKVKSDIDFSNDMDILNIYFEDVFLL